MGGVQGGRDSHRSLCVGRHAAARSRAVCNSILFLPHAFFFTGIHKDYHQPTDTPDKIDYPKLLRIARYVYDIGFEVADATQRPLIDPDLWSQFKKSDRRGRMPEKPATPMKK